MASDLLSIARSGAQVARIALEVTAQNIANASSTGYVRRSVALSEVAGAGSFGRTNDLSLSGARLERMVRNADMFRQAEVRRTGSDAARAGAELAGLENVESAVEQSGLYPAIVGFESALQRLASDPVDPSLRTAALEDA
ncbi:MAG: flagellar basal body protein, partial [Novosphingobium sp.]